MPYPQGSASSGRQGKTQSNAPPPPPAPVAAFEILDPDVGQSPGTVVSLPVSISEGKQLVFRFTGVGPVDTFSWDPGDGGSIPNNNDIVFYTYNTAGDYSPTLTVTNATGSDNVELTDAVVVTAPLPAPQASFSVSVNNSTRTVTVTDQTTGLADSISINWGDGTPLDVFSPGVFGTADHTYANVGTYDITLTATNASGSTAFVRTITLTSTIPTSGTLETTAQALNANDASHTTTVDVTVPFARTQNVLDIQQYQVTNDADVPLPTQWKVISRWHGTRATTTAPVKLAVASVALSMPGAAGDRTGRTGSAQLKVIKLGAAESRSRGSITITDNGGSWTVTNGSTQATILKFSFKPFNRLSVAGNAVMPTNAPGGLRVRFQDQVGLVPSQTEFATVSSVSTTIVEQDSTGSSTKVRIRQRGDIGNTNSLRYEAWWTFRQGTDEIEFEFYLRNEYAYAIKNDPLSIRGFQQTNKRAVEYAWVDFGLSTVSAVKGRNGTTAIGSGDVYRNLQAFRPSQGMNGPATPWGSDFGLTLSGKRTMRHIFYYMEGVNGSHTTYEATPDPARSNYPLIEPFGIYDGVWDIQTSAGFLGVGYEYYWQKAPSRVDISEDTLSIALFPEALPGEAEHERGWQDRGLATGPKLGVRNFLSSVNTIRPTGTNPDTGVAYELGNSVPLNFPTADNAAAGEAFPVPPATLGGDPAVWGRVNSSHEAQVEAGKRYLAEEANLGGTGNAIGDVLEINTSAQYSDATVLDTTTGITSSNYIVNRQQIGIDGGSQWVVGYPMRWTGSAWTSSGAAVSVGGNYRFSLSGRLWNGDALSQFAWRFDGHSPRFDVQPEFRNKYPIEGGRKFGMRIWVKPRALSSALMSDQQLTEFQRRVEFPPAAVVASTTARDREMLDPLPLVERKSFGEDFDVDRFEQWLDLMISDDVAEPISSGFSFGFPQHLDMGGRPSSYGVRNYGWDHFGDMWGADGWMNNSYDTSLRYAEGFLRTGDIRWYHQGRFRVEWTINAGILKEDIVGGLSEGYVAGGHIYEKGDPSGTSFLPDNGHWWVEGAVAWCRITGNEQYIQDTRYAVDWALNDYDSRRPGKWGGANGLRSWGWPAVGIGSLYAFYGPITHQGAHPSSSVPNRFKNASHTLLNEIEDALNQYEGLQSGTITVSANGIINMPACFVPEWLYETAPTNSGVYAPPDLGDQNPEVNDVTINMTPTTYVLTQNIGWPPYSGNIVATSGQTINGRDYSNNGFVLQRGYNPPWVFQIWMLAIAFDGHYKLIKAHPNFGGNYVNTVDPILLAGMDNMAKMRNILRYSSRYLINKPAFDAEDGRLANIGIYWAPADRRTESTWISGSEPNSSKEHSRSVAGANHMEGVMVNAVSHDLFIGSQWDRSTRQDNDFNLATMFFRIGVRYFQQWNNIAGLPRTSGPPTDPAVYDQITGAPAAGTAIQTSPPNGELYPVSLYWENSGFQIVNKIINSSFYRWGLPYLRMLHNEVVEFPVVATASNPDATKTTFSAQLQAAENYLNAQEGRKARIKLYAAPGEATIPLRLTSGDSPITVNTDKVITPGNYLYWSDSELEVTADAPIQVFAADGDDEKRFFQAISLKKIAFRNLEIRFPLDRVSYFQGTIINKIFDSTPGFDRYYISPDERLPIPPDDIFDDVKAIHIADFANNTLAIPGDKINLERPTRVNSVVFNSGANRWEVEVWVNDRSRLNVGQQICLRGDAQTGAHFVTRSCDEVIFENVTLVDCDSNIHSGNGNNKLTVRNVTIKSASPHRIFVSGADAFRHQYSRAQAGAPSTVLMENIDIQGFLGDDLNNCNMLPLEVVTSDGGTNTATLQRLTSGTSSSAFSIDMIDPTATHIRTWDKDGVLDIPLVSLDVSNKTHSRNSDPITIEVADVSLLKDYNQLFTPGTSVSITHRDHTIAGLSPRMSLLGCGPTIDVLVENCQLDHVRGAILTPELNFVFYTEGSVQDGTVTFRNNNVTFANVGSSITEKRPGMFLQDAEDAAGLDYTWNVSDVDWIITNNTFTNCGGRFASFEHLKTITFCGNTVNGQENPVILVPDGFNPANVTSDVAVQFQSGGTMVGFNSCP